jgi:hypothetical protein
MKLPELKGRCKDKNITIPSKAKKGDIVALLDDRPASIWSGKSVEELKGECATRGLRTERANGVGDASIAVLIARLESRTKSHVVLEEAVKVMSGTCTVGFLPKSLLTLWGVDRLDGLSLEANSVLFKSESIEARRQSFLAGGKIVTQVEEIVEEF